MIVSTLIKHCSSFLSGKQKRKGFAEGINEIENNPDIQTREQIDAILKEQGVELPADPDAPSAVDKGNSEEQQGEEEAAGAEGEHEPVVTAAKGGKKGNL